MCPPCFSDLRSLQLTLKYGPKPVDSEYQQLLQRYSNSGFCTDYQLHQRTNSSMIQLGHCFPE